MRGLKGRNVVVTGGASGIGQATATRFVEEGCAVCIFDNSAESRSRVSGELPQLAGVIGERNVWRPDAMAAAAALPLGVNDELYQPPTRPST